MKSITLKTLREGDDERNRDFATIIPQHLENHAAAVSIHNMRLRTVFRVALLTLCGLAAGQTSIKPPCEYSGEMLRQSQHKIKLFTSDEMKARATYKHDIFGAIKQADIKGTTIVDVLVGPDGQVVCTKSLIGHPMVRASVEDALRKWKFSLAEMNGRRVAYLGRIEFTLCNISCGESGPSMTIVN